MKIGFSSVTLYKDNFENVFKKISESSYDAIELNAETLPWATPHIHNLTTNQELEDIFRLSKKYNLEISSIGAHINISQKNDEERKSNVDYVNSREGSLTRTWGRVTNLLYPQGLFYP